MCCGIAAREITGRQFHVQGGKSGRQNGTEPLAVASGLMTQSSQDNPFCMGIAGGTCDPLATASGSVPVARSAGSIVVGA
jgi:hypothetical protein